MMTMLFSRLRPFGLMRIVSGMLLALLLVGAVLPATVSADGPPTISPSGNDMSSCESLVATAGVGTLTADDCTSAARTEPFAVALASYVDQSRLASNFIWVLVTGY